MWRRIRYLLLLIGLCTLATCPVAKRACDRQSRNREADAMLDYLENRLRLLATSSQPWPTTSAAMTPAVGACCDQGGQCEADAAIWRLPTWQSLRFEILSRHYFSYEYVALPGGSVVLRAMGDVDCSGNAETYERTLTRNGDVVDSK
jgi:type II secretory pathway pseudopilin PulG